jgi:uncharacterized membrane protein YgaE (UPF0421/DUF939 family)
MVTARGRVLTTVDVLNELGQRSKASLTDRLRRVRSTLLFAAQAALAAGMAWLVAHDMIKHPAPFFAPIAAVIVLNVSVGQRMRRAVELVFGVALGILVGDLLIYFIGTGAWQIGVGVAVAILAAVFLGGSATVIGQAASSAVLVATLAPPRYGIYYSRFIDALIGGVVGVAVLALLLPVNPLTVIRKAAKPAFQAIVDGLHAGADALERGDREAAEGALAQLRTGEASVVAFRQALDNARETATLAPVRWRARVPLAQYVDAAPHVDHSVRNARVLARRTVALLRDGEPVPAGLPSAVHTLAEAITALGQELAGGNEPVRARELTVAAVTEAAEAYRAGAGFSSGVVVAQVRTIGTDLLLASGLPRPTVEKVIRRAVGRVPSRG